MPLGKDLASIRKSQNLTLEDIQKAIKIPITTLKSIEDESIFHDDVENKTYRRSFIRSYAKMLRLDDDDVVRALDAMDTGTYRSEILTGIEEEYVPLDTDPDKEVDEDSFDTAPAHPPANTPQVEPKPKQPPAVNTVNWADMGRKFNTVSKSSKAWVVLVSFLLVILLAGGAYVFSDDIAGFFGTNPSDQLAMMDEKETSSDADSANLIQAPVETQIDATDPDRGANNSEVPGREITLGDTLVVAVYAAYGQLEPIRVTSDFNWRTNPYWMEQGEAYNFEFQDTLLVRGQYSRLLLLFNGRPIENPRQNHFSPEHNSIMITRSALNQPRYLAPAPEEFPLEVGAPDSIVYRIRF